MEGYIQIYTGNGKGKTTAALGLALRAVGAGMKVFVGQFAKGRYTNELKSLLLLKELVTYKQYGRRSFIRKQPNEEDIRCAREGFREVKEIILLGYYDMVILDEAAVALHYGLFTVEEFIEVITAKPAHVEIVITGRYADWRLIEHADLVTVMIEAKHYFRDGIKARSGIDK